MISGHATRSSAHRAPRRKGRFLLACVSAFGLLFAVYSNHFHNAFHFDDTHVIEQNLYIRSLSNLPRFFTDALTFTSLPENAVYRPLVSLTFAFDGVAVA